MLNTEIKKKRLSAYERTKRWRLKHPEEDRLRRKRYYEAHRERQCASSREWYRKNKARAKTTARRTLLRNRYGLTEEQYVALGSVCAICGRDEDSRKGFRLSIDHCHDSKKVRGLLCGNCNVGIGHFKHDEALMQQAIAYLRRTA